MKLWHLKLQRSPRPAPTLLGAWLFGACLLPELSGCGQKGALFLPDPRPQAVPAAPATATPATATPGPATPDTPADTPATRKAPRTPDPAAQR